MLGEATMSAINFDTSNRTFRQLMGNGLTYHVPRFQRDYSWTEEEWDDLWQDLLGILPTDGEPAHYMGYLVLQTSDNKLFDIIDGQQRLTTLSLLILAILKNIQTLIQKGVEAENNQRRLEQLRNSYIGFLDPVTLVARSKLTLNRNNDAYYQDYLVPLERIPKRNLKASEHLLRKAFEWFETAVSKQYPQQTGIELAQLIDTFADKLFFTVIIVNNELNAFKVFETLNARGVRLSATDLLKNYLFSIVHKETSHETEILNLEARWERIVENLGGEKFPDFLRVHWNSRHRFVRQANLFKTIRNNISNRSKTFNLLRQLEEDADVYAALGSPEDSLWAPDQREYIGLLKLFNVRQPYMLLLAAKRQLEESEFTKILRGCCIITFRHNTIGGLSTGEQERFYNSVAKKISDGELTTSTAILSDLRPLYVSDEQFQQSFAEKQIRTTNTRNKQLVRYILFKIEQHLTKQEYDQGSDQYSLEHVLPEQPSDEWQTAVNDDQAREFLYRLGNMTLLNRKTNRDLGNAPFAQKAAIYRESSFLITRKIAEDNAQWDVERIANRQRWLAKQAKSIWRIEQLS